MTGMDKAAVRARLDKLRVLMPEDEIFRVGAGGMVTLSPKAARLLTSLHAEELQENAMRAVADLFANAAESGVTFPDYVITDPN